MAIRAPDGANKGKEISIISTWLITLFLQLTTRLYSMVFISSTARRHKEDLDALMGDALETLVMFEKDCMSEYTTNVCCHQIDIFTFSI